MDHLEAKRLQAAEKYVLGELPEEIRDEYEEHYFDCCDCAQDVKAAVTFVGVSREVFREEKRATVPKRGETHVPREWFAWLKPAFAVPVIAGLLLVIGYQNVVTIPDAKQQESRLEGQVFESSFRVQGATRGETVSRATIRPGESFVLDFDFTPAVSAPSYSLRVLDATAHSILTQQLSKERVNKELHLVIPGGMMRPGRYQIVIAVSGQAHGEGSGEAQRIEFEVAYAD